MRWIIDVIKRFGIVIGIMIAIAIATVGFWAAVALVLGFAAVSVVIAVIKYIFTGNCDL